jgi:Dolichyl-phosphate-mannose-protein mannosyltransferase
MSISAIKKALTSARKEQARRPDWQTSLFWATVIALFAIAIFMRLYHLGLPFDRDSYDEGVYWQSLRAMGAGHALYGDIFYSQPPFFLLSTYPIYAFFGASLWSARLAIAIVSLFGPVGAFLLGKALSGRLGALATLLLVIIDPLFLAQSQTIQAEASSVAFSLLAIGLAFYWWKYPSGWRGLLLAILTGVTVALSVMCKLLGVALLVPVLMMMVARLWWGVERESGKENQDEGQDRSQGMGKRRPYMSVAAGIGAFLLTMILLTLPFLGSFQAMWTSVVTFHTGAGTLLSSNPQLGQSGNTFKLETALATLLTLAAFYGSVIALLRRDWRVLPLLGWLLATAFLLWRQVPLFSHHFVSLTPPLIGLAVMGIAEPVAYKRAFASASSLSMTAVFTWIAVLLILFTAMLETRTDLIYYNNAAARGVDGLAQLEARVAADLDHAITPGQQVVTDAQFIADLASRDTPPALVDTSMVRITTGSITLARLEALTAQPQVHAVLFFTGRFGLPGVATFHAWVAQRFHLLHNYGSGRELWVR